MKGKNMLRKLSFPLVVVVLALAAAPAADAATFTWTPAVTASSTGDVFDVFGSTVTCKNTTFSGPLPQEAASITLSASYSNCTVFGLPGTVTAPKDGLTLTADGTVHYNEAIVIQAYGSTPHESAICKVTVPAQTPSGKVTYTNNANGTITISGNIGGMTATQERKSIFCPAGTHTTTGNYTTQLPAGIVLQSAQAYIHLK